MVEFWNTLHPPPPPVHILYDRSLNPEKTKFLLVGTRQLLNLLSDDMSLNFLNKTIVPVTSISDLEIILDRNLTYNEHITQLSSECMAKLCQII